MIILNTNYLSFEKNKVINYHIFKIPEQPTIRVFVSDVFRQRISEAKLKGFNFIEVWDSEEKDKETKEIPLIVGHIPYVDATKLVLNGKAIASGKWKVQKDKTGNILIGELLDDGKYHWIDPVYYPPIFHDMLWLEVELSDI